MARDLREEFEASVDAALEPADYPGDDTLVEYDEKRDREVEEHRQDSDDGALIPARVRWSPTDRGAALWCLRRYRRAVDEISGAKALADQLRAQAAAYEAEVEARVGKSKRFFEWKLGEYHAREISGQKSKLIKLPGGRLKGAVGSVKTDVTDRMALLAWLRAHAPEAVRTPSVPDDEPDLVTVKKLFGTKIDEQPGEYSAVVSPDDPVANAKKPKRSPGDIVPGVRFVRGDDRFDIELDDEISEVLK